MSRTNVDGPETSVGGQKPEMGGGIRAGSRGRSSIVGASRGVGGP